MSGMSGIMQPSNPASEVARYIGENIRERGRQQDAEEDQRRQQIAQFYEQAASDPRYDVAHQTIAKQRAIAVRLIDRKKKLPKELADDGIKDFLWNNGSGPGQPAISMPSAPPTPSGMAAGAPQPQGASATQPQPQPQPTGAGTGIPNALGPGRGGIRVAQGAQSGGGMLQLPQAPPAPAPAPILPQFDYNQMFSGAEPGAGAAHPSAPSSATAAIPTMGDGGTGGSGAPPSPPIASPTVGGDGAPSGNSLQPPPSPTLSPTMMSPVDLARQQSQVLDAQNTIIATGTVARMYGVPEGTPINLRTGTIVGKSLDRATKLRLKGLDENGDPLPDDQLPPEMLIKRDHMHALESVYTARVALMDAQRGGVPEKIHTAQRNLELRERELEIKAMNAHTLAQRQQDDHNLIFGDGTSASGGDGSTGSADQPHAYDAELAASGASDDGSDNGDEGDGSDPNSNLPGSDLSDPLVHKTFSGMPYVNVSGYTGKVKAGLKLRYERAGIPTLEAADAEVINEIDNARLNQQDILKAIVPKLPKDALGRATTEGLSNRMSAYLQTDEELAAYGAFRAAAIQSLRAIAGSKGFRINQAEIELALANDIPKITDTVAVALHKSANINKLLTNAENARLRRDKSRLDDAKKPITIETPSAPPAPSSTPTQTPTSTSTPATTPTTTHTVISPSQPEQRIVGVTTKTFTTGPHAGQTGVWTGHSWQIELPKAPTKAPQKKNEVILPVAPRQAPTSAKAAAPTPAPAPPSAAPRAPAPAPAPTKPAAAVRKPAAPVAPFISSATSRAVSPPPPPSQPSRTPSPTVASAPTLAPSPLSPSHASPRDRAIDFFERKGWTREQALGIAANIHRESDFDHELPGDEGTAYGLFQWRGDRQNEFKRIFGHDIHDSTFDEQLEFAHHELTAGSERGAGKALQSALTPREAAEVMSRLYERPADGDREAQKRGHIAEIWATTPAKPKSKPARRDNPTSASSSRPAAREAR